MPWFRHHYHCEACAGSWLAEAEVIVEADCPFCRAYDVAPYRSEDRADAAVLRRMAASMRRAMAKPAPRRERQRLKRVS